MMFRKSAIRAITAAVLPVMVLTAATVAVSGFQARAASPGALVRGIAASGPSQYLSVRRTTLAPFSFVRFCDDYSAQCEARGSTAPVSLTPAKRDELRRINTAVNREIRYEEDASGNDVWKIGVTSGDCEDYVLAKRQKLLAAGWPSGAVRIAVARTSSGIGHAVLVVTTAEGDLVLDNRSNTVRPWHATSLKWLKIQSPENPRKWQAL